MSRLSFSDLRRLAAPTDGLLTRRQLLDHGWSDDAVSWRCRPGGPWQHPEPGVVALFSGALTPRQRMRAAVLYAGPCALLTGAAVLRLHRLRALPPESYRIPVLLDHRLRRAGTERVAIRRTTQMPAGLVLEGLPAAPLARAVTDFALTCSDERAVMALVCEVVQRRRLSAAVLSQELAAAPRRGSAGLREAVAAVTAGVWSVAEGDYRTLVRRSRVVPEPRWNVLLAGPDGAVLGRPDGWIHEAGVAIQVQSVAHHFELPDWERTMEVTTTLSAAGLIVVQVRPRRIIRDPAQELRVLESAYRTGLARGPVPGVVELPGR